MWLLEGLGKMRFLTTSQLGRLYFNGSRWSPNKRLRKLLDAGYLKVWVRNLSEENIYSITRNGIYAIENENMTLPLETKIPSGLDGNLQHLLSINEVRTSLALSLPEANGEIIWWRSDWELRSLGRDRIIPDGLFLIKWHGFKEQAYALEVDNNTKSARNFLRKILAYVSFQARGMGIYGISEPIVLVGCSQPKWMERYRVAIKQLGPANSIWFATIDEIKRDVATGSVWINGTDKKCSLRELSFYPYCKEGRLDESNIFQRT
jgi:hypothetical protein